VYIRYLAPIMPSEVKSRDEMGDLVSTLFSIIHKIPNLIFDCLNDVCQVRRRILEAMKECPKDIGADLSSADWIKYLVSVMALFIIDAMAIAAIRDIASNTFQLTGMQLLISVFIICVVITLVLYFYYVEVIYWGKKGAKKTK
jgi:hypothetical protein